MKQIFTLLCILSALASTAQSRGSKISGHVLDGSQKVIEAATISLLKLKDSGAVKYALADREGNFFFENIPVGTYVVEVSASGHKKGYSEVVTLNAASGEVVVKTIELVLLPKTLNNITVTARKALIELKADKMIVNVDAAVTNVGATALEVLEKTPGVSIDKDGNISLKGKQGVYVMMDGKPAYLSGTELTNYLKGLPASAIDQIEIMTNPSAKYDAAGNSGIINIKSKKNKQNGLNGSVTLDYGQGVYWKTNNSVNVNYRNGKFNVFANGSINKGNGFQSLNILRKFKDAATSEITNIFQQETHMRNINTFENIKIGVDYYLSARTTLGVVANTFTNPEKFTSKSTSLLQDSKATVDSIVYAVSSNNNKWKNSSINLNFRHQFDSTGTELTSDVDYVSYKSAGVQNFTNTTLNPNWDEKHSEQLFSNLPVKVDIYSAKLDFSKPLKKEAKLEGGIKSSYVKTNNTAAYFNILKADKSVDYSKTNNFLYKENINAAYVNWNRQFKKFGAQLGLRYEFTSYSGNQFGNPTKKDSSFQNTYGNLFPTAYLSYMANKDNQFSANFGRRIDRPAYQDLNPFLFFLDEYTYERGNPFLRPQFSNNIELSHSFKGFLNTTLNYSHTKDFMSETFEQARDINGKSGFATIVSRGNIGRRDEAGVAVNAQIHVSKWWMAMLYGNYNYSKFEGTISSSNEKINIAASNILFNINNQFNFKKGWSAELSGFYRTRGIEGQIIIQPLGQASAGIGKQILKNKGAVKLNVRDIFLTNRPTGDINFGNTLAHFSQYRDSRAVNLSFTYRFGKPLKDSGKRRKIGGAEEEQNRVKRGSSN
ncbi:MAG: outer membrane beta-barrel family protein [Flavisolibacter sp.]